MIVLPNYDSPNSLRTYLEQNNMAMQKKFGQNFLINKHSRELLVSALNLNDSKSVWEIGPGLGAMTSMLLETKAQVTAFEIDRGFSKALKDFFGDYPNFSLIEGDVLKTWQKKAQEKIPDCLFGNLPYNIAATIIGDTIEKSVQFDTIIITVQKEVALRMAAKSNTADYSSFSILCQWAYTVETIMDLKGGCFWPQPNVTSRAVKLTKKKDWPQCKDPKLFQSILRSLFSSRRKTIKNNFLAFLALSSFPILQNIKQNKQDLDDFAQAMLLKANLDPSCRAETLLVSDFITLSDIMANL